MNPSDPWVVFQFGGEAKACSTSDWDVLVNNLAYYVKNNGEAERCILVADSLSALAQILELSRDKLFAVGVDAIYYCGCDVTQLKLEKAIKKRLKAIVVAESLEG